MELVRKALQSIIQVRRDVNLNKVMILKIEKRDEFQRC